MSTETIILLSSIAGALVVMLIVLATMYVKAPPSQAYVLSGLRKVPRILIGTGGFKIPIIERLDLLHLGDVTVDIKTPVPVPTHDFIDVKVDAVCKARVKPDIEGLNIAAKNFLNMPEEMIAARIKDSLEGNMREVIGAIPLNDLVTNRDAFSDQVQQKAARDMDKLGLEILSCNIQNITDTKGLITDLGADNTYKIKKDAAINKANAEKEIAIAESDAKKIANDVRIKNETEIAERNNELEIKQAELKKMSDTKKAESDAAYEIQRQEQLKTVNIKTVDAEIEQTKRQQVLSNEKIKIKQNELTAEVNAKADAEKYETEIAAQARLEQQKREAEATTYLAEQEAKALKAQADAKKYAALQEAEGIRAKGEAEADAIAAQLKAEAEGIKAKGIAEAESMQKKAEAYERYGQVAIIDMLTKMNEKVLPEVAKNVAEPMSKIGNVTVYGTTGTEMSGVSHNVPTVMKQTFDVVKDVTGVDMSNIMMANSLDAKVQRNVNIKGDEATPVVQVNS